MQDAFFQTFQKDHLTPARVSFVGKDHYRILIPGMDGDFHARARGRFHGEGVEGMPVVGDWVVVYFAPGDHEFIPIEALLPRRTVLQRMDEGGVRAMVTNIDHVGIVTSFNQDLNPRRLERGIAMALEGGARPFVALNKSDLLPEPERAEIIAGLSARFGDIPIVECSAIDAAGVARVASLFATGESVTLLGMSGVGKSTLINALMGAEVLSTGSIRQDDGRGRHTTTHRELFRAPGGYWLVDGPGIRAFAPAGEALEETFGDVAELAAGCRFGDCGHAGEPGCAVGAALESGALDADRWENYRKLAREQEFHERKHDKAWQAARDRDSARRTAALRESYKTRGKK